MTKIKHSGFGYTLKRTTYAIGKAIVGALSEPQTTYQKYINSEQWKQRALREKTVNPNCSLCNRKGILHAHHRTYVRLGNERQGDLVVLCDECHKMFHKFYTYEGKTGCFIPNKQLKLKPANSSIGHRRRK